MNKYQKERSREIRDIMRTDLFGRMTYKEAKRKWRKGIRAFRVGDTHIWEAFDLARLGFSRSKMREVGQAYHKIAECCAKNELKFHCSYAHHFLDEYILDFRGTDYNTGRQFGITHRVSSGVLRQERCSLAFLAEHIIEEVDCQLKANDIRSVKLKKLEWRPVFKPGASIIETFPFILGR